MERSGRGRLMDHLRDSLERVGPIKTSSASIRPEDRPAALARKRNLKMARSAHAYVRGSTVKFYEWLDRSAGKVPEGPPIWICGDCHIGNLGPLADGKGRVAMQIRDLDQTVIGNPAHDLIRLALSLASAARGSDLPGVTTALIMERIIAGYEAALGGDDGDGQSPGDRPADVQKLLKTSLHRRWRDLARERLDGVQPVLPLGKKFWVLTAEEKAALPRLFAIEDVTAMVAGLDHGDADTPVELIDAAYWMKGCSSLGRLRYAAMLRVGSGKHAHYRLVDIKEAATAAAPRAAKTLMPRENAVRVRTGALALSPHLGERMVAARLLDTGVVLRELTPQDLKIEVERLKRHDAEALAAYLAGVVGQAHGRQMDAATREAWRGELRRSRTATLDAPSWLWSSVVELLSIHEAAYLDHCRRFSLAHRAS